jgi:hypothetical protein
LDVWSYCASDWRRATTAAGGVTPYLSPPESDETIDLAKATTAGMVYLNLHGYPDQPYYYGQRDGVTGPTALSAEHVAKHDWSNVVVFAEVCFSTANGGSEIAKAFLANGAKAFIGSTTEAYGRIRPTLWDGEADRLAYLFRVVYGRKTDKPLYALTLAKRLLAAMSYPLDADDRATLESFICLMAK